MKTPASVSVSPTVGANCRGGVTTDAMGWLKCGAEWTLVAPGRASTLESELGEEHNTHKHTRTHAVYPGSGPSWGGKTPTPACLSLLSGVSQVTRLLLELFNTHKTLSLWKNYLSECLGFTRGGMKSFLASSPAQEGVRGFI